MVGSLELNLLLRNFRFNLVQDVKLTVSQEIMLKFSFQPVIVKKIDSKPLFKWWN